MHYANARQAIMVKHNIQTWIDYGTKIAMFKE